MPRLPISATALEPVPLPIGSSTFFLTKALKDHRQTAYHGAITENDLWQHVGTRQPRSNNVKEHGDRDGTFSYCSSSLTKPGFGFISPLRLRTYLQAGSMQGCNTLREVALLSGLGCSQLLGGHDVRDHNRCAPARARCERGARVGRKGGEAGGEP